MIIFYILLLLLLLQAIIIPHTTERGKRAYLLLAFIELQIVSGLRIPLGGDSEYYTDVFGYISGEPLNEALNFGLEKGFMLFLYVISLISIKPQIVIFLSSLLLNVLVIWYIYKNSNMVWLSVVLYVTLMFFFNAMNLMRFMIACSILLYSNKYIIERKLLKFIALIVIASSFHFSGMLYSILYILYPMKISWKSIVVITLPFIFLSFFFFSAFQILIQINDRYTSYGDAGEFYQSAYANILEFLICFCILLFFLYRKKWKLDNIVGEERLYFWLIFLSAIFSYMSISVMIVLRFAYIFSLCYILVIANLISKMRNPIRLQWIMFFLVVSILKMIVILTYRPEWYFGEPYQNWII